MATLQDCETALRPIIDKVLRERLRVLGVPEELIEDALHSPELYVLVEMSYLREAWNALAVDRIQSHGVRIPVFIEPAE